MGRIFFSGMAVTVALLLISAGVLKGQETPPTPPAPQAAPHPQAEPELAPEAPEPPEPMESMESPEVFVMNDGTVHLGVTLADVSTGKAQELKLPAVAGAIVNSVQKNSAAAKAGIVAGDAIIEFDGVRVRSSAELRRLIRETPAGRTVAIKIVRSGKTSVLSAKLEASANHFNFVAPEVHIPPIHIPEVHIPPMDFSGFGDRPALLGITGDDLTPQLAQYFNVKQGKGVLIFEVTKGGAADKAGLKAGDVIVQVDGKPISGVEELRDALNDNFTDDTHKVSLTIVRDHHEQNVNADLTRSPAGEKHSSSAFGPAFDQALAKMRAQANLQRAQADQFRAQAESQRALVQAEVTKQQAQARAEWQRQLQQQMKSFKDQFRQMQNLHVVLRRDREI